METPTEVPLPTVGQSWKVSAFWRFCRRKFRIFLLMVVLPGTVLVATWPAPVVEWELHWAGRAIASRRTELAIQRLKSAAGWDPQSGEIQFRLARGYRHLGNMNLVRWHLERALRCGYSKKAIMREEWLAQAQAGQMREADLHLSDLLQDAGSDGAEICEAYVNGYFLTTRFRDGLNLLDVWQEEFPQDAQPYLFRGRFLEVQNNSQEAAAAYREGLRREPQRTDLQLNLARCLIALHEHAAAIEILNQLEAQTPSDPDVLQNLGNCLLQQGQLPESKGILRRLLQRQPQHVVGRLTLARVELQEGRHDDAFQLLKGLAEERPYDIEVRYSYAMTLLAIGQKELAAESFRFVTEAREAMSNARRMMDVVSHGEPDNADLRYQIGKLLLKYESPSAGAGWLRSVLEINPNHRPAHEALASYYDQSQNPELANLHRVRLKEIAGSVEPRTDR